jgi:hypothetical protein
MGPVNDFAAWQTRTPLQRVVQILKWHCMITFAADLDNGPPSILLTTLTGRAYDGEDDLFTAVRIVLDNMTQFVERRGDQWWVPNPDYMLGTAAAFAQARLLLPAGPHPRPGRRPPLIFIA